MKNTQQTTPLEKLSEENLDEYIRYMGHGFDEKKQMHILERLDEKRTLRKPSFGFSKKLMLAFALFFVVLSGTAYGASRIWEAVVSRNNHEITLSWLNTKKENSYYQLKLDYLPEGFQPQKHDPLKFVNEKSKDSGLSVVLHRIKDKAEFKAYYSKRLDVTDYGDKKSWVISQEGMANSSYTTKVFVAYEAEGYVIELMATGDISSAELGKIIEGLKLVKTTKDKATPSLDWQEPQADELVQTSKKVNLEEGKNLFSIGGTFATNYFDFKSEKDIPLTMSVKKVEVLDSIAGFDFQNAGNFNFQLEELKDHNLLASDGKLQPFICKTYQKGDGINRLDEVKSEEILELCFLQLTVMVRNDSETPVADYYVAPRLYSFEKVKEGQLSIVSENDRTSEPFNGADLAMEPAYIDKHGTGKAYYNIGTLEPNKKQEIIIGYFTTKDELSKLYFSENPENTHEIDEPEMRYVKLFDK